VLSLYSRPPRRNMTFRLLLSLVCLTLLCLTQAYLLPVVQAQAQADPNPALDRVLSQMDSAAANFHTTEAAVLWDQYQKVVDEHESQKGKVYFRRAGNEIQMAADITEPDQK
jgi:hypothetical protein